ncbi:MAG: RNA-binding S4 domain-containing protein [Planktomarina sp.]|nr:RNA-binding S4 domain-containing protein [Planktomarina sp.]
MNENLFNLRIDKWLWQARFFKTRSLATKLVKSGKLRINGTLIAKPSRCVVVGDVITFPKELNVRVIEIRDLGKRRGPASEAQALYTDLSLIEKEVKMNSVSRISKKPTTRERKALIRFKKDLE